LAKTAKGEVTDYFTAAELTHWRVFVLARAFIGRQGGTNPAGGQADGDGKPPLLNTFDCAIVGPQPSGWRDQVTAFIARREFITLIGGVAAAWPLAATAEQMPVIGFLRPSSAESVAHLLVAFRAGLKEERFVEGQNVAIEYRWAEGQEHRLGEIVAELVRRQVDVIVIPGSTAAAHAAKAVTTTVPIVFSSGVDPVKAGLIASLNRPGGNITGIYQLSVDFVAKRLGLLHELVPAVSTIAVLVNPVNALVSELTTKEAREAARLSGLNIKVFPTRNSRDIDGAFTDIADEQIGAALVGADSFFTTRRAQLATLASRFLIPAVFPAREYAEVGGLMSYGENQSDVWRRLGIYVGRVLKGEKDLPVEQSARFELIINLMTAKAFRLDIPATLLARADEVIE
jgi:putative ABC transport system substrate-binding protein